MNTIEHDSQNLFYRSPFGAVTVGTDITLRISVADMGAPVSVKLLLFMDGEEETLDMPYVMCLNGQYIYERTVTPAKIGLIWYYFKIYTHKGELFYGNNNENLGGIGAVSAYEPVHDFQITVYSPYYKTPAWFKKAVVYQIFPDRFFNGNDDGSFLGEREDIIHRNWNETPYYKAEQFGGQYLSNDFFGGNLKGIIKKLPYLKELGVSAVYLNPIFKAYSNHKYDTGDYKQIDPMFGDEKTFSLLCMEAKKLGIRIILDGVFNHTGSDSRYFNKTGTYDSIGAYQSKESPYYSWYKFTDYPDEYESWWGIDTLPHINEEDEGYRQYILKNRDSVVKHWIEKGAAGWRLDVVDELPDFFVQELRRAVKAQNKDAVIIGEVWEDASHKVSYGELRKYFLGDELDSVMNYPLRDALLSAARGYIDAEAFHRRLMSLKENYPREAFYALLNILSTHDVERAFTLLGGAPEMNTMSRDDMAAYRLNDEQYRLAVSRMKQVSAVQILLPGVPCVFYGDETGMQGYADPFCRGTYPWGQENEELILWYKTIIQIRTANPVFCLGEFETIYKVGRTYGFIRYNENHKFIVLANFSGEFDHVRVDIARFGVCTLDSVLGEEHQESRDGIFFIDMPGTWVKIFKAN